MKIKSSQKNTSYPIGPRVCVQKMYNKLSLSNIISPLKQSGLDLNVLTQMLLTFRMQTNNHDFSIRQCVNWANSKEILEVYGLPNDQPICDRTFYRAVEILGANLSNIIYYLREVTNNILPQYKVVFMDWTTEVLWGIECPIGDYGYSKAHRRDKKQVNIGCAITNSPYKIPICLTVVPGNINDKTHGQITFDDLASNLLPGTTIVFDRGAFSYILFDDIVNKGFNYLAGIRFNSSIRERIKTFEKSEKTCLNPEEPDEKKKIYCMVQVFPTRRNYIFYSEEKKINEINVIRDKEIRKYDKTHKSKKSKKSKKTVNDDTKQVLLVDEEDKAEFIERKVQEKLTGQEGFFVLCSNLNLTPIEALKYYREKDIVEKLFYGLKNEINPGPMRVWTENALKGICLISYLVHLFLSLYKVFFPELEHLSMKIFIMSLKNLTETYVYSRKKIWGRVVSNFDNINKLIYEWEGHISTPNLGGGATQ